LVSLSISPIFSIGIKRYQYRQGVLRIWYYFLANTSLKILSKKTFMFVLASNKAESNQLACDIITSSNYVHFSSWWYCTLLVSFTISPVSLIKRVGTRPCLNASIFLVQGKATCGTPRPGLRPCQNTCSLLLKYSKSKI